MRDREGLVGQDREDRAGSGWRVRRGQLPMDAAGPIALAP